MDIFVKTFQKHLYNNWKRGIDFGPCPQDPGCITLATIPDITFIGYPER